MMHMSSLLQRMSHLAKHRPQVQMLRSPWNCPSQCQLPRRHFRNCTPVCMGRRSSKIATRKNSQDMRKAKLYGKLGKLILQAVKAGGPDAVVNSKLKEVLKQAQQAAIPKDIVDRNIKKGSDKSQADFQEVTYEAYGAGGTGFVMECLTDNLNRSASEVRAAVVRAGGKMADPGSVLFNFQRLGQVFVGPTVSEDEVYEVASDAGAEDILPALDEDEHLEGFKVLTQMTGYAELHKSLQDGELPIVEDRSGLIYNPLSTIECDDKAYDQNEHMLERLMAVDDIDNVHTNCAGLA